MYKIKKFDESAENVHKILKILSIFCAIIIIPIIIYNIVLMAKSMINPNKIPSFLGMKSLVIISESMEPTIMPNDAIFVKNVSKDELKEFKTITSDTCDRRSFSDKSLKYYEEMYDCFKDDVTFKICEINLKNYIQKLEDSNREMASKLEELSDSNSNLKKKEVMKKDIENNNKKIQEAKDLKQEKGEIIPLSAAMFILYGDEIIYLFSGSYAEYMQFCGQYRLQWEIIKYAADHNYKRYNFFGIQDVFNPNGKDRGVYEFKKGFGGYVEELLGAYELSLSPVNTLFNILKKIKHIIKK